MSVLLFASWSMKIMMFGCLPNDTWLARIAEFLRRFIVFVVLSRRHQGGSKLPRSCFRCGIWLLINTLRLRQDGRHFPVDIFKCILMNENKIISIQISLKFVPKVPINNIPVFVQIMTWRRPGDKPLSEPMVVRLPTQICVTRLSMFFLTPFLKLLVYDEWHVLLTYHLLYATTHRYTVIRKNSSHPKI